jgi:hypothetical protein
VVFFVVGVAILGGAAAMPTFYERLQQIYTAPGLVPGFYGAIILLLSVWLCVRSVRRGALTEAGTVAAHGGPQEGNSNFRLFLAALVCLIYCVVLIGRMPFWLSTSIFVAGFIMVFEGVRGQSSGQLLRKSAEAVAIGLGTGVGVTLLFEKLFLVRLP